MNEILHSRTMDQKLANTGLEILLCLKVEAFFSLIIETRDWSEA